MASELTTNVQIRGSKSGASLQFASTVTNDMAGNVLYQNTQTIGTTTEQITLPLDLSGTPSWLLLKNIDATNFIEVGLNTPVTQIFAKLLKGQSLLIPPGTATLYAKADTAGCKMLVIATEA